MYERLPKERKWLFWILELRALVKKWEKAFEKFPTKNLPNLVISELSRESAVVRDHLNGNFEGIHISEKMYLERSRIN